ncbi:MAG: hypothetical protein JWO15_2492 [Sphingomonadales bacterium]|nr:hypothetical protein [Sphingomonadales bacterium]
MNINENLIYSSPRIVERRRRILDEARRLVSEFGYDGFGIRELCQRAQVAPQTVYKAFENKERLVSLAIRQYFQSYAEEQLFHFEDTTLEGVIERLIVGDAGATSAPEYVSALVAIHFSQTAQDDLRVAASYHIMSILQPWAQALRDGGHMRPSFTTEMLTTSVVHLFFGISLDWCRGAISDEEFLQQKFATLLTCAVGATHGPAQEHISTWLTDVLGSQTHIAGIRKDIQHHARLHPTAAASAE